MSEFEETWRQFLDVLESEDASAAVEALNTWQRVWDRTFWNREFDGWDAVYEDEAELVNNTKVPGIAGGRGTTRWREAREEASDIARYSIWEAQDVRRAGEQIVGLGRVRAKGRFTGLLMQMPLHPVWTLNSGKISRVEFFGDRDAALEAAGLAE